MASPNSSVRHKSGLHCVISPSQAKTSCRSRNRQSAPYSVCVHRVEKDRALVAGANIGVEFALSTLVDKCFELLEEEEE